MDPSPLATQIAEWLLDLEHIRLGRDEPLSLYWQSGLPLWFLGPLVALVVVVVGLMYRGESGGRLARMALAVVRVAVIVLVIMMICQPVLRLQRDRIEPSHVGLLIDVSRSMAIRDGHLDPARAERMAAVLSLDEPGQLAELRRIDLVRQALLQNDATAIRKMLARNRLEVYSFGRDISKEAAVSDVRHVSMVADALGGLVCEATATNIPNALSQVLRRTESGRLAAIVLASDGRTTEPTGVSEAIAAAKAQQVPIYPILIGSPVAWGDLSIEPLATPETVFFKDSVTIRARVSGSGLNEPTEVNVRLIREGDHATVATQGVVLDPDRPSTEVELRFKPQRAGRADFTLQVAPLAGELETENNLARTRVNVVEEPLRVLYVEGLPRYEYRYLKNALLREPTIRSSCLLLSADLDFVQEGSDPIRRFPDSEEELGGYDVVLFGDVDPRGDWLSPAQQEMLVEWVSEGGGGFGLIAGTRHAPLAFRGTPLEKLIPVRIDPAFLGTYAAPLGSAFQPRLTVEGRHSGLFRFLADGNGEDMNLDALAGFYWIARTLGPKAGAEVLCEHPQMESPSGPMPLMVLGRYGGGRVFFSATDETWRWRRGGGEWIFDGFWLQVCRALMKPVDVGTDRSVVIRTDRRRYRYGERVEIQVEVLHTEVLASLHTDGHVLVLDSENKQSSRVTVSRLGGSSRVYEGAFVPSSSGSFSLEFEEVPAPMGQRRPSAMIQVAEADLELRHREADHGVLRRLATETGGAVMELDEIEEIAGTIADRSVRIPDDVSEPLWDSKLVLAVFILMIGVEWVVRKACGML